MITQNSLPARAPVAGNFGWNGTVFTHDGVTNFHRLSLEPMFRALVAVAALALFFHPPKTAAA